MAAEPAAPGPEFETKRAPTAAPEFLEMVLRRLDKLEATVKMLVASVPPPPSFTEIVMQALATRSRAIYDRLVREVARLSEVDFESTPEPEFIDMAQALLVAVLTLDAPFRVPVKALAVPVFSARDYILRQHANTLETVVLRGDVKLWPLPWDVKMPALHTLSIETDAAIVDAVIQSQVDAKERNTGSYFSTLFLPQRKLQFPTLKHLTTTLPLMWNNGPTTVATSRVHETCPNIESLETCVVVESPWPDYVDPSLTTGLERAVVAFLRLFRGLRAATIHFSLRGDARNAMFASRAFIRDSGGEIARLYNAKPGRPTISLVTDLV